MAPERGPRDVRLERLVFLVDGIYAIAMTLLAVELILPESSAELAGDALLHSLWDGRYRVLAYVTSFLFIANFWVGTLMILRHLRRFDGRMLWIVLVHMLLIAFIPYPTSVIGQHPDDQVAQVFYFATLTATALFLALLWWYASARRRLVDVDISQKVVVELHRNSIAATALFLVLTGLSVVGIGRIVSGLLLGYVVAALSILMAVVVNVGDDAESETPLPESEVETGGGETR